MFSRLMHCPLAYANEVLPGIDFMNYAYDLP